MSTNRFYVVAESDVQIAFYKIYEKARRIANANSKVSRIYFLVADEQDLLRAVQMSLSAGKAYGEREPKADCRVIVERCVTVKKFKPKQSEDSTILVCLGMDSDRIFTVDWHDSVSDIIAITATIEPIEKWLKTWAPLELNSGEAFKGFPRLGRIARQALEELTEYIDSSFGITDFELEAKAYMVAMHKYCSPLQADVIMGYLIAKLNWLPKHAKVIERWINTLNGGGCLKGIDERYKPAVLHGCWQQACRSEEREDPRRKEYDFS